MLLTVLIAFAISGAYGISDSDYSVRSLSTFNSYFPTTMSLLFQIRNLDSEYSDFVALQPTIGNLNGSAGQLWIANQGGKYSFTATENCVLLLTESLGAVRVSGGGYTGEAYGNGSTIAINSGSTYTFEWAYTLPPILPISLLMGLIGVCMIFGGSLGGVHYIREREFKTVVTCLIVALIGVALVIGWFY